MGILNEPRQRERFLIPLVVFGTNFAIYVPLTAWIVFQVKTSAQLWHAFLVFILASALLVYEKRLKLRPVWQFGGFAKLLTGIHLGLIAAALALNWNLLLLPGFVCLTAAAGDYVFGPKYRRVVFSLCGTFLAFLVLALLLPVFDWPLRDLAGRMAGYILALSESAVQLGILLQDGEPALILVVDDFPFHVAAECNGFGVITASLLLALLLVLYRRLSGWVKVIAILLAGLLGLVFNLIRILMIVRFAPLVGSENYMLMHEIVGSITYYTCLALIWTWIMRLSQSSRPTLPAKAADAPGALPD